MLDDASAAYLTAIHARDTTGARRIGAVLDAATVLEQQRHDQATVLGEALAFAAAGVPVFPIRPRGKQPLTGHGFKDATTDPAVVRAWWAQWPDANLGLPTGVAFDVVDIDGAVGVASLYNGPRPVVDTLDVIGVARTSRDGGRHLYVPVTGRGNKTAIYPGVDYRGAGGYVVAPPSVGVNGVRYQWARPLTPAATATGWAPTDSYKAAS